jgi:5-methylcytosine-specific restriction endonuclease McrA
MDTKTCSKCGETKPATEFARRHDGHDGLNSHCKACCNAATSADRASHPERWRAYESQQRSAHPEKYRAKSSRYRTAHHDDLLAKGSAYRTAHREELAAKSRAYYADHREERCASVQEWAAKNPDRVVAYHRSGYERNKTAIIERGRQWLVDHPDIRRSYTRNRRARLRNAPGTHTAADVAAIRAAQGNRCFWCGEPLGRSYHVDHYIPLSKGGSNWPENLDVACARCNERKNAQMPGEFLEQAYA